VLRPDDAAARQALAGLACRIVINPRPELGPASSIARGAEAVREGLLDQAGAGERAVLVLLPDMPFVDADMLRALVDRYHELERGYEEPERPYEDLKCRASGAFYVTARYGVVVAPPVVLPPRLLAELAGATGVLREHLHRAGARAETVDLPPHALADVDTPRDWDRLLHG
jgi:CTP:molybdopterin cytidylyltransferase MocA